MVCFLALIPEVDLAAHVYCTLTGSGFDTMKVTRVRGLVSEATVERHQVWSEDRLGNIEALLVK